MDIFNQCGELCQEYGMKFGYHNHDFEFYTKLDGEVMYDIILDNTDPNLVTQQMDIGNMYGAGGRALEILGRYPGRFELLHVKDEIESETGPMSGYESTVLRSEEHTSELQSRGHLVCRLLLEKKKTQQVIRQ